MKKEIKPSDEMAEINKKQFEKSQPKYYPLTCTIYGHTALFGDPPLTHDYTKEHKSGNLDGYLMIFNHLLLTRNCIAVLFPSL
jgi:hypothetical protein